MLFPQSNVLRDYGGQPLGLRILPVVAALMLSAAGSLGLVLAPFKVNYALRFHMQQAYFFFFFFNCHFRSVTTLVQLYFPFSLFKKGKALGTCISCHELRVLDVASAAVLPQCGLWQSSAAPGTTMGMGTLFAQKFKPALRWSHTLQWQCKISAILILCPSSLYRDPNPATDFLLDSRQAFGNMS